MIFSIIIPVYNLEKYIEKCVQSVYNQGLDNNEFELLIINDGSTDGSKAQLELLEDYYPNIWVCHKQNGGVSSARNEGIRRARGKYVLFLDGDDELFENALIKLLKNLDNEPDVVVMNSLVVEEDGRYRSVYPIGNNMTDKLWKGTDVVQEFTRGSACGVAFSRELLIANQIMFNENIIIGEDSLFLSTVYLYAQRVKLIPIRFYKVIRRENSASNTLSYEKVLRFNYTLEVLKSMIDDHSFNKEQRAVLASHSFRTISTVMEQYLKNSDYGSITPFLRELKRIGLLPLPLHSIKKYWHNILILNISSHIYYRYLAMVLRLRGKI